MSQRVSIPAVQGANTGERIDSYHNRIAKLSDKLSDLHQGLESDRNSRFDTLNGKMRMLDERLATSQDAAAKRFASLKDQLVIFQKELEEEKENREALAERKAQEIASMDQRLQAALDAEQQARKESAMRVLRIFEDKTQLLKEDIAKESTVRLDNE